MYLPVYPFTDYGDLKYRYVTTTTTVIDRSYYMYDDYLYTCEDQIQQKHHVFKIQNC
jgi:hypothetical protein